MKYFIGTDTQPHKAMLHICASTETNETIKKVINSADAVSNTGENVYESVSESKLNKSKINKNTEPKYKPQVLKMFSKDSITETNDTFHIYWYKYVQKK